MFTSSATPSVATSSSSSSSTQHLQDDSQDVTQKTHSFAVQNAGRMSPDPLKRTNSLRKELSALALQDPEVLAQQDRKSVV